MILNKTWENDDFEIYQKLKLASLSGKQDCVWVSVNNTQWGVKSGASRYTITLPIAFTNNYQILANTDAPTDTPFNVVSSCEVNNPDLSMFHVYTSHNSAEYARGIHWIAIGI